MRFLTHLLLAVSIGLAFGFGLSWLSLTDGRYFGVTAIGPWHVWRNAGAPTPDPYSRAFIVRHGALQLGAGEGLQFVAATDSDGRPLDRACRYRIDGRTPTATFWTLTPTDAEGTSIAVAGGPQAFSSRRIARANDGSMELYVGPRLSPLNWLETTGTGPFELVLNVYDLSDLGGGGALVMPTILREDCA